MTTIRVPWKIGNTINDWNEACIWAIEQFGLPGDRYTTHPDTNYMDFVFQSEKDAIYFALKYGEGVA
jgi:hypothetical protein